MMKAFLLIRQWYFPIMGVLATAVYILRRTGNTLPEMANNHFNDLLCMPIVLKIAQSVVRYIKSDDTIFLPVSTQMATTLIFCFYFEWHLPQTNMRYTGDWLDVMLYFLGLLLFNVLENSRATSPE